MPLQQTNLHSITNKLKDQESLFIFKEWENIEHCPPLYMTVENTQGGYGWAILYLNYKYSDTTAMHTPQYK